MPAAVRAGEVAGAADAPRWPAPPTSRSPSGFCAPVGPGALRGPFSQLSGQVPTPGTHIQADVLATGLHGMLPPGQVSECSRSLEPEPHLARGSVTRPAGSNAAKGGKLGL